MKRISFFLFLGAFLAGEAVAEIKFTFSAQSAPELDAVFQNTNGWIGADGSFSTPLSQDTTLWLFSDTWIGEVHEGKRVKPKLINNTIALQKHGEKPKFFYPTNSQGEAEAFVKPADGEGYFWLFAATRNERGLYIFLRQMMTTDPGYIFGFKTIGVSLGYVANPDDPPLQWKITQTKVPFTEIKDKELINFGTAMVKHERQLYIFGNRGGRSTSSRGMIVARVAENELADFKAWRFFVNGKWEKDFRATTPLFPEAASEASVSFLPALQKFVFTYSFDVKGKIVLRTADAPFGPWSKAATVFECPEMTWSTNIICYAGKAHPQLATKPDEMIITYAANSRNWVEVVHDARLYWPRFVRVNLRKK